MSRVAMDVRNHAWSLSIDILFVCQFHRFGRVLYCLCRAFPCHLVGKSFLLVAVDYLTRWAIIIAKAESTAQVVLNFVQREIMYSLGPPRTSASSKDTSFTAPDIASLMARLEITLRTIVTYALMSGRRTERKVGTLKTAVRKIVLETGMEWDTAITEVLFGCRQRSLKDEVSPFGLLYRSYLK